LAIDRNALVSRHNPVVREFNLYTPLSVGNGELAFTADITGLQTFSEEYYNGIPLCTQSQWGWHTTPVSKDKYSYEKNDFQLKPYKTKSRIVGYPTCSEGQSEIYNWLRLNPHRLHLGQIGFEIILENGCKATIEDINAVEQRLDMWSGLLTSTFTVESTPVKTKTCCHPHKDVLSFSAASTLLEKNRLKINIKFPYGSPDKSAADWLSDDKHSTEVIASGENHLELLRILDEDKYFVHILFSEGASIKRTGRNSFCVEQISELSELELSLCFSKTPQRSKLPDFKQTLKESARHWEEYWNTGGIIELTESSDERAQELERRIILSQYLTAIQCSGSHPPQETGLTFNSWYGRFHLEMHWWHAAHFPLWGRPNLLQKSMWWYKYVLPKARELAKIQGYRGVRWPKMPAYDGVDCPSPIAPLLIWQQPHPIYYAELLYRAKPTSETLEMYADIVFQTAEFMASYAEYDSSRDTYDLGPALIPAQENHKPEATINPTYELEYWKFGLDTANLWRQRLGLKVNAEWIQVSSKLAPLAVDDGVYLAHENCEDTFRSFNEDHPSMLAALGVLPGSKADKEIMLNTLYKVLECWKLEEMWGWDFPMIAMTAARLGKPEIAVDLLLMNSPKNEYLLNGHNRQGTREDLPIYLPGNGALLMAAAMMATGWEGCTSKDAPGFPKDGRWKVSYEGLSKML
jgi:protein-glucosylgalactosylhydroxylysine glucosidase